MTDFEIWLRNGLIIDGTGDTPFVGDVAIKGDTINHVTPPGAMRSHPHEEIDCTGLAVVPGFIDIHTHSDLSFVLDPAANSKLMQGVTTEVVGNCGFSPFPVSDQRRHTLSEFLSGLGIPRLVIPWSDFDGYADAIEACRPIMNVAPLVGHGTLRIATVGMEDVPIDRRHLGQMESTLSDCLERGAFGLSTGLSYVPSRFAGPPEIHALARVLRKYDALYATHARSTADPFETFDEAIDVGKITDVRVQYSHLALNDPVMWGRAGDVIERFQQAVNSGVDIRYDVYPYDASASALTQYLPAWLQEDGEEGLQRLLSDPGNFAKACDELGTGLFGITPWDWDRVVVSLTGPDDRTLEGKTVSESADLHGVTPEELCLRLVARHGNRARVILFYRTEADVTTFLTHPLAILGSDGSAMPVAAPGCPHPRSFGAHARLLQRYVTEHGHLSLAQAVHKATSAPAHQVGIEDRGLIAVGTRADISVFHIESIRETATWTQPCKLAAGVREVWVNGERVVAGGELTGSRAGRVLRRRS